MTLKVTRFLSLLLVALTLGMVFCHVMEIPCKLRLAGPAWLAVQHNLYIAFGRLGAVIEVLSILLTWVVVVRPEWIIAAGNFSLTAALLLRFSLLAAEHIPQWEILDYASFTKPDVPSGTARELAERLGELRKPKIGVPVDKLHGPKEARGADIGGTRVHSLRLPSYIVAVEAIFGAESERLTIRHDAGASPAPYVAGTLLAARKVGGVKGLVRGLDRLLFG